jgi:hypothetical protein
MHAPALLCCTFRVPVQLKKHHVVHIAKHIDVPATRARSPWLSCCVRAVPSFCRLYLRLQHLYRERADQDVTAVQAHLFNILKGLGREGAGIGRDVVRFYCKNARSLRVTRWEGALACRCCWD